MEQKQLGGRYSRTQNANVSNDPGIQSTRIMKISKIKLTTEGFIQVVLKREVLH